LLSIFREDDMFGLGTTELIIILVLVMIVFGAGKLPQVASSLGKGVRNFKDGIDPNLIDDEEIPVKDDRE
jgi:sec-independent protein translocase protein TatA